MKLKKSPLQKKNILFFATIFLLVFTNTANVAIFKTIDSSGTLLQTDEKDSPFPLHIEHPKMQAAFNGYIKAQEIAFRVSANQQGLAPQRSSYLFQPQKLVIIINDGDWAYNNMYGAQHQILNNKGRLQTISAPSILLGRNIPLNNNPSYMGEILAHETGHAVMNALYNGKDLPVAQGQNHSHDSVTNPDFAFAEGFAEYYGAASFGDSAIPRPYHSQNPQELNSTEGYIACVLLEIHNHFNQEDIFTVMAETKPKNCFDFLEAYMHKHPNRTGKILEILRQRSGLWPPENLFSTNPTPDLNGDGIIFSSPGTTHNETAFDRQTALLQSAIQQNRLQLQNTENYLKDLLRHLGQLSLFRQQIININPPHSQKFQLLNQVENGQKKTLALYEKYAKIIARINDEYEILTGRLKMTGPNAKSGKIIPKSAGFTIQRQDKK